MKRVLNRSFELRRWRDDTLAAAMFLTRWPVPARREPPPPLSEAMRGFPVVGAVLGLAAGAIFAGAAALGFPPLVAAAIAIACLVLATGALHEDGLADTADGFGGGDGRRKSSRSCATADRHVSACWHSSWCSSSRSRRSQRRGRHPGMSRCASLPARAHFSRALIVWLMGTTSPARPDGLSASAGQPNPNTVLSALLAGGIGGGVLLVIASGFIVALLSLLAGLVAAAAIRMATNRQIGGQTGDVCGAVQALAEAAMLAVASLTLP